MKNSFNEVHPYAIKQLKENSNWYLALGISFMILGGFAIFYATTSTLFSVVYLGCLLVVAGIFEAIQSWKLNRWGIFLLHVLLAIFYIAAGLFIINRPMINAVSLTLLLSIFFIVSGVAKMIFAVIRSVPHRIWLGLNGLLTLILGILVLQQWPFSGLWFIGLLVGVDMIFTGCTLAMLSLLSRDL